MTATTRSQSGDMAECLPDSRSHAPKYSCGRVVSTWSSLDGEWKLCEYNQETLTLPWLPRNPTSPLQGEMLCWGAAPSQDILLFWVLLACCSPPALWINQLLLAPVQNNWSLLTNGHQQEMLSSRCWQTILITTSGDTLIAYDLLRKASLFSCGFYQG